MAERVKVGPISGFPEWSPGARLAEQRILDAVRRQYELFGFTPIETPAVERLDVLLAKGGIQRQIFTVSKPSEDRGGSEGELGLHFDLTVPLARYVAQRANELTFPFRRYQIQKVWRGERAQRGRFREFLQCDIDIVGSGSLDLLHDAEIAVVIGAVLDAVGVDHRVHVSNRKVLTSLFSALAVDHVEEALRTVDKLGSHGPEAVRKGLGNNGVGADAAASVERLLGAPDLNSARAVLAAAGASEEGIDELAAVVEAATQLGMPENRLVVDLAIARGLDYYTGTVYETFVTGREGWGSVCSGGRYDDLAGLFIDRRLPGVGVSLGLSRLFDLLVQEGMVETADASPTRVLVTAQDRDRYLGDYLAIAGSLRAAGIPAEVYLQRKKLGDQFSYAKKLGIPLVVIAGESEVDRGVVTVRDMRAGTQSEVARDHLPATVKEML
jgi:histidyl-tRNA synthetase